MRPLIDLRFQWQFMARTPLRMVEPAPAGASRAEELPLEVTALRGTETMPLRTSH
jgi:hypothetical protein